MNNKEFIASLAERTGKTQKDCKILVERFVRLLGDQLEEGRCLQVSDLGHYEVRKKRETIIWNASTQQRELLPPQLMVTFVPTESFVQKIHKK